MHSYYSADHKTLIDCIYITVLGLTNSFISDFEMSMCQSCEKFIKELNIPHFNMHDVEKLGIESVMEITLKIIMRFCPNCQIHLSFDIDCLDPKYAPSTGTPVPGGLSLEEGKYICRTLGQTGCLKSMVVVEVNTLLGSSKDAATALNSDFEIIKSALLLD
uniref:Arginase 2 mitochondrial n=1 Tax=Echinococcus granulosus TaxID=6210 RepID=A0A068WJQ8_ECHGR|nr:arginase 2 mitochondrial [Echinococcus granulosus]